MTSTGHDARWWALRVLVVPTLGVLALLGYYVTASALAVSDTSRQLTETTRPVAQPWKARYSERFPGCVAAVLWPGRETPVAVVVQWRSGEVERVARGVALRRALSESRADDGRIIGACR